jgi:molecular chaperone DnaK
MENMINFGIDLGTTNSVIAKFVKGEVQIFTNSQDFGRSTLPSVVAFKKDTVFVGNKAKEFWEKRPKDVVGTFKRKMGTSESYKIASLNQSKTPIDLSAYVLKELKTFVHTGDTLEAVVITIPASFDTIQSNATKSAGEQAGFKQVVLLQEPIAASLAYANKAKEKELKDGQWLVYDLGGGTFDVALVKIQDGEMKVIDHEGDNFLGGADFDRLIVEKMLIPKLEVAGNFDDLENEMKSASGKYNGAYLACLNKTEQAKIALSARTSAEIEVQIEDDNNNEVDEAFTITRSEFEGMIKEYVDNTIEMVKKIIVRNSLTSNDLQFILMVGGSTFIPYVRKRVEEVLQIPINCDIDPTTAVCIGAAFYAGTKQKSLEAKGVQKKKNVNIKIKAAYQKVTQEDEEFFAAKIDGNTEGLFYKITREDGGFNTGLKALKKQIQEDLPLVKNAYNFFTLTIYDAQNNVVETDAEPIGIAQGKFGVAGQPLPNDICLEVDDMEAEGETRLELIFQKNTILPLRRTITKTLNKTVVKGSEEEVIRVRVLEGSHTSLPEANKYIGFMDITGKSLARNVSKGSDIEIVLEISESRDLTISAYLNMADQEFKEVFNGENRSTPTFDLADQVNKLSAKLSAEIKEAEKREDYETAKKLHSVTTKMNEVVEETSNLVFDDVTDKRYQLEDKKRKIAQEIDNATKDKRVQIAKGEYFEVKERCSELLSEHGNDYERKIFNDIVSQEKAFLASQSPLKVQEWTDQLQAITMQVLWRTPQFLALIFKDLVQHRTQFNDQNQAKSLIEAGKFAIQSENWDRLGEINQGLINLLPRSAQKEITTKIGF